MKKFTYFPNHGDEDGRNSLTVCYGEADGDEIIICCTDKVKDAKESCRRLNKIMKQIKANHRPPTKGFHNRINQITEDILRKTGQL